MEAIFSHYNAIDLEIQNKKPHMTRVLKHTSKQWFEGETIMETRKYLK